MTRRLVMLCLVLAGSISLLSGCGSDAENSYASWIEVRSDGTGEAQGFLSTLDYQPVETGLWTGYLELAPEIDSTDTQRFYIQESSEYVSAEDAVHRASLHDAFEFVFRQLDAEDRFLVRFRVQGDMLVVEELIPQVDWGEVFFTAGPIPDAPLSDPAAPVLDDSGRTPIDAVEAYFEAVANGDPEAIYATYAPGEPPEYGLWHAEWAEAAEVFESPDILDQRVISQNTALVRVTYRVESPTTTVEVAWPGEWWRVEKVGGRWFLGWLPRQ